MMLGSRPQSRKTVHGSITKLFENFGYVNDDIFFMRSVVSGGPPRVGDRVFVTANHTPNMPVKWSAEAVRIEGRQDSRASAARTERSSSRHSRSQRGSRAPPSKRSSSSRQANYVVNIPHRLFSLRELSVMELRQRYPRLHLPSDFFHAANGWQSFFPLEQPFRLGCESAFHIFPKEADSPHWQQAMEAAEPEDHDYRFSAKVMLLAGPQLAELYRRTCGLAQDPPEVRDRFTSLGKVLHFLCGFSGDKVAEPLTFGGPWSPSLDGENVEEDPQVLVNTAVRHLRRQIGLDLSSCSTWYKFTEFHYCRYPRSDKDKRREPRLETVVMFLPDVWNIMPDSATWQQWRKDVQEQMDRLLFPKEPTPEAAEEPDASQEEPTAPAAADEANAEAPADESMASQRNEPPADAKEECADVHSMKVADLRKQLEQRGLDSKGLKAQLVARLEEAMKTEAAGAAAKEMKHEASAQRVSPLSEQEQQRIRRNHELPERGCLLVNPSRSAKGGKLQCQLLSLSQLLAYRLDATKEHTFEVSLFAEQFNEMLTRDCAFNIYASLAGGADEPAAKKPKEDDNEDDESGDDASGDSTGLRRTVRPDLLLSFVFFDREHSGHLLCKDVEELVLTLGLLHSRSQVRKWVEALGERRSHDGLVLRYRSLTDRAVRVSDSDGLAGYAQEAEAPTPDELRRLLEGNRVLVDDSWSPAPGGDSSLRDAEAACAGAVSRERQCVAELAGLAEKTSGVEARTRAAEAENAEMRQRARELADEEALHRDRCSQYRDMLRSAVAGLDAARQPLADFFEQERLEAERRKKEEEEKRQKEEQEKREKEEQVRREKEEQEKREKEEQEKREKEEQERKRKEEEKQQQEQQEQQQQQEEGGDEDAEMKEDGSKSAEWSVVDAV